MTDIQLQTGELWEIGGERHFFDQAMGSGFLLFRSERTGAPYQVALDTGEQVSPTMDWFVSQFAHGLVRRLSFQPGASKARRAALLREDDYEAIVARDPRTPIRQIVLSALDRMTFTLSDQGIRRALEEVWAEQTRKLHGHKRPGPTTVRTWLKDRGQTGERALKAMVSQTGRVSRQKRLSVSVRTRMHEAAVAYWADHAVNITESYGGLRAYLRQVNRYLVSRGWSEIAIPGKETFRQHVRSLECYETVAAKWGTVEAKKRFKPIGKGLSSHRPLLLGAMDHTLMDVHLVLELDQLRYLGRPWLTILIDVHSRCIVGWVVSFEPPSLYSVTECIKRANRPKLQMLKHYPDCPDLAGIYGKFDEIVVDNGLEFVGTSFESGMTDVGTSIRWAPSASPTYKAVVERFFRTLNERLNKRLPGGSFPVEYMKAWKLNPQKDAVLTLDQLEKLLEGAIGLYHQDLHTFLGEAPVKAWSRGVQAQGGVPVIGDDAQLDKMVGAVKERRLSTSGISLFGLKYHDPAVTGPLLEDLAASEPMRGRRKGSATAKVTVKYNPANIGSVHVWNQVRGVYQTLPCTEPEYAEGLTSWQQDRLREWEREEQERSGEARANLRYEWREKLRALGSARTKKRIARNEARLLTSPKIQTLAGDHLRLDYAQPRHDGMAPVIPQKALAPERSDDHRPPTRPQRGGARKPRPKSSPSPKPEAGSALEEWSVDSSDWGASQ